MADIAEFKILQQRGRGLKSRLNLRMSDVLKAQIESYAMDWQLEHSELARWLLSLCFTMTEPELKAWITERVRSLTENEGKTDEENIEQNEPVPGKQEGVAEVAGEEKSEAATI